MTRYYCERCNKHHNSESEIGRAHAQYTSLPSITVRIIVDDDCTKDGIRDMQIRGDINTKYEFGEFKPSRFRQIIRENDYLSRIFQTNTIGSTKLVMKYIIIRHWVSTVEIDEDTDDEVDEEETIATGKKIILFESILDELEELLKID